jgi:hypothetical protein
VKTFKWKTPPGIKVYEASSAIGAGRVTLVDGSRALVRSSTGNKEYLVTWSDDGRFIEANDNGSHFVRYLGYPSIAVLMLRGVLKRLDEVETLLALVQWKSINTQHNNDYTVAMKSVFDELRVSVSDRTQMNLWVEEVLGSAEAMALRGRLNFVEVPPGGF